jgi:hypothetical protein
MGDRFSEETGIDRTVMHEDVMREGVVREKGGERSKRNRRGKRA